MGLVIVPLFIGIAYFTTYPLSQFGQINHLSQKLNHDQHRQDYETQKQLQDIHELKYGANFQTRDDVPKYQRETFRDLYKLLTDNQRITNDIFELVFNRYHSSHSNYVNQPNNIDFAPDNYSYEKIQKFDKASATEYVSDKYDSANVVQEQDFGKINPIESLKRKFDYRTAYIEQNPVIDDHQSNEHASDNYKYEPDDTERKINYIKNQPALIQYEPDKNENHPNYVNEDKIFIKFTPVQEHESVRGQLEQINDKKLQKAIKYTQKIEEKRDDIRNKVESFLSKPSQDPNNQHSIKVENSQSDEQIVYVKEEPERYYVTYPKESNPIAYKLDIGDHEPDPYQSAHVQNVVKYDNIAASYNKDNNTNDGKDIIMPQ